jgi:hypothetical protein
VLKRKLTLTFRATVLLSSLSGAPRGALAYGADGPATHRDRRLSRNRSAGASTPPDAEAMSPIALAGAALLDQFSSMLQHVRQNDSGVVAICKQDADALELSSHHSPEARPKL